MTEADRNGERFDHLTLLTRLVSQDWRERRQAIDALLEIDDIQLAQAVLEIIRREHLDLNALSSAIQVMERMGRPLTDELIALLDSPDKELRVYVPLVLSAIDDPRVAQALIRVANDQKASDNLRFNAIEALGKLKAEEAVESFLQLLNQENDYLKFAAVLALGQIGDSGAVPYLRSLLEHPYLGEPAIYALGQTGSPEDVPAIVQILEVQDPSNVDQITAAAAAIGAIARRRGQLDSVRAAFRKSAGSLSHRNIINAAAPGRPGACEEDNPSWADLALLISWAPDSDWEEAQAALVRLIRCSVARPIAEAALMTVHSVPRGLAALLESADVEVSYSAARILAAIGDPASFDILANLVSSEDESLAAIAAAGLGRIGGPQAGRHLLNTIGNPSVLVRRAVASALQQASGVPGRDVDPEIEAALMSLLNTGDPNKRDGVLRALAVLNPVVAEDALFSALQDSQPEIRITALSLLPMIPGAKISTLIDQGLNDPISGVRGAAVKVLVSQDPESAASFYERALNDVDGWVRHQAVRQLSNHSDETSARLVERAFDDPSVPVRLAAVNGIVKMSAKNRSLISEALSEHVKRLSRDDNADVRQAAANALGKLRS